MYSTRTQAGATTYLAVPTMQSTRSMLRKWKRVVGAVPVALAWLAGMPAGAGKPPVPVLSVPMTDLGYQPVSERFLLAGDTMFTLHFVDDTHLLVTFSTKGLLARMPDADADDQPRNVEAVLLELPTGKVLARTTWHLRDHGQYLIPIAHGRFLLRVREKLVILAPLMHLGSGKPFEEEPFLDFKRKIGYISVSPGGDLLAIETTRAPRHKPVVPRTMPGDASAASALGGTASPIPSTPEPEMDASAEEPSYVEIHLIRMVKDTRPGYEDLLVAANAGLVRARALVDIPATSEGFLDISKESPTTWLFDFQGHAGKRIELAPFDTSCMPRAKFVSRSEFVAFGCRGSDEQQQMAAFNFKAEELWINAGSGRYLFPSVVSAPDAGRFALSRTPVTGTYVDPNALAPDQIGAQEVTVFQTHDGRSLLKLQTSPVQRAAQNFDLSPDGMSAAVIHNATVEVYRLPALTGKDRQEIASAAAQVPAVTTARVELRSKVPAAASTATVQSGQAEGGPAPVAAGSLSDLSGPEATPAKAVDTAEKTNAVGDPQGPRKAPTLYTPDHPKTPQ